MSSARTSCSTWTTSSSAAWSTTRGWHWRNHVASDRRHRSVHVPPPWLLRVRHAPRADGGRYRGRTSVRARCSRSRPATMPGSSATNHGSPSTFAGPGRTGARWPITATGSWPPCCSPTSSNRRGGWARWATWPGRTALAQHTELLQFELDRYRGRKIKDTGDGLVALFDGSRPRGRMRRRDGGAAWRTIGLEIRAGVHTGEVELVPDDVRGVAVHLARGSWTRPVRERCWSPA